MLIAKLLIQQTLADAKQNEKDIRKDPFMIALSLKEKHSLIFKDDSYTITITKITENSVDLHTSNVHKESLMEIQ